MRESFPACCCTASPVRARLRSILRACARCSKRDARPSCSSRRSASRPRLPPICIRFSATKLPFCTPRSPTKSAPSSGIASRAARRAWWSARAPRSSRRWRIWRLIIVDEEHDSSYKQEETPRYHARDIAVVRAKMANAVVVLGSATPSLESYFNAKKNKYALVELPDRVEQRPLPEVEIVDMRQEFQETGHEQVISRKLAAEIKDRFDRKEQVMVLLNRRGYSPVVLCRTCGKTLECQNCAIALTHHKREHKMVCHYCGYTAPVPKSLRALRQRVRLFSRHRIGKAGRTAARHVSAGAHRPTRSRYGARTTKISSAL